MALVALDPIAEDAACSDILLTMKGIDKSFPGVRALSDVMCANLHWRERETYLFVCRS